MLTTATHDHWVGQSLLAAGPDLPAWGLLVRVLLRAPSL